MKTNHNKATPRVYHTLRQIVQRIPRWLIEKTASAHGVDARKFSATSHLVMLILGHLSRASCLTEICDDAGLNKRKLSLVRNATPGRRNTFSHANSIASYSYRSKKAAAKMLTRLHVGSFIPYVVRIEAGKPHDPTMADELTKDMKGGDILLVDRAYVDFLFLHNLTARDMFWVLRQKVNMPRFRCRCC